MELTGTGKGAGIMGHICTTGHLWALDNIVRRKVHNLKKMYGPYVKPGMRVLDLGCGSGFTAAGFARLTGDRGSVLCVDVQQEMLDITEQRLTKAGLAGNVRFHRCEADSLNLSETFDFANAFWMVHEVPDAGKFFGEVYESLEPGGLFFIAEPKFHVTKKKLQRMIDTARQAGFSEHSRPHVALSMGVILKK